MHGSSSPSVAVLAGLCDPDREEVGTYLGRIAKESGHDIPDDEHALKIVTDVELGRLASLEGDPERTLRRLAGLARDAGEIRPELWSQIVRFVGLDSMVDEYVESERSPLFEDAATSAHTLLETGGLDLGWTIARLADPDTVLDERALRQRSWVCGPVVVQPQERFETVADLLGRFFPPASHSASVDISRGQAEWLKPMGDSPPSHALRERHPTTAFAVTDTSVLSHAVLATSEGLVAFCSSPSLVDHVLGPADEALAAVVGRVPDRFADLCGRLLTQGSE